MKQKSKEQKRAEKRARQTDDKPHTSRYARKCRAQSAYYAAGGTWAGWIAGRQNHTIIID